MFTFSEYYYGYKFLFQCSVNEFYKKLIFFLLVSTLRQSVIQSSKLAGEICSVFTPKRGG